MTSAMPQRWLAWLPASGHNHGNSSAPHEGPAVAKTRRLIRSENQGEVDAVVTHLAQVRSGDQSEITAAGIIVAQRQILFFLYRFDQQPLQVWADVANFIKKSVAIRCG